MATTLPTSHLGDIVQGPNFPRRSSVAVDYSDEETGRSSTSSRESCTLENDEITPNGNITRSSSSSSSSSCCYLTDYSVEDIETGGGDGGGAAAGVESGKMSVHLLKVERDCRICHLSLDGSDPEFGLPIELGCSCKEDLSVAHKHCAETWFKIRGNKTCEICGSTASNVVGASEVEMMEQWTESNDTTTATHAAPPHPAETRNFWQGHRFLNFLLACMVFAFVISWLFHFNVPS